MKLGELDTPALLVDVHILERNLRTMQQWVSERGIALRPHFKEHKIPLISWKQLHLGAKGISCQTLSEAELLVASGVKNILITNQIVSPGKIGRLANLCKYAERAVCVDNPENVTTLAQETSAKGVTLRVLVEIDTGRNWCGVQAGRPALELAREICRHRSLVFEGIQEYAGHLQVAEMRMSVEEKKSECEKVCDRTKETRDLLEREGLHVKIVTRGGTGTYRLEYKVLTDLQAGTYALMDWRFRTASPEFEIACSVLATVISTPSTRRVVVDAGRNSVWEPIVKDMPNARYECLGAEHGMIVLEHPAGALQLSDKVQLHPSRIDSTVQLHDRAYAIRDGEMELMLEIAGRRSFQYSPR